MKIETPSFRGCYELGWYIFACVLSVAMMIPLFFFSGSLLHMTIGIALSVCAGILIVLKRFSLKISVILLSAYLLIVPVILFYRMELPLHDMANMLPMATVVTVGIFYALYAFLFIVFRNVSIAVAAGNILLLLVTVVEFYVHKFKGSVIGIDDIRAVKTAMMVMGNYDYTPSHELVYSAVIFVFCTVLAAKININAKEIKKVRPKYPAIAVHAGASLAGVALIAAVGFVMFKPELWDNREIKSDMVLANTSNEYVGSILYPIGNRNKAEALISKDFDVEEMAAVVEQIEDEYVPLHDAPSESKPNVILIMNESFSDLRVLGDFETTEPVMPFWDSFLEKDGVVSGNLYVPVLGGITVNSEFEALTGNSLFFLPEGTIPYYTLMDRKMDSLVSEFGGEGYHTVAIHPNLKIAYERDRVYEQLGFDEFVGVEDFDVPLETIGDVGSFVTDNCNYDELIYLYENRDKTTPYFFFNVTIQNHGGYSGEYKKLEVIGIDGVRLLDWERFVATDHYLSRINDSDIAFQKLIEYFEKEEEPVIICMFGDHQPLLQDIYYSRMFWQRDVSETEQKQLKYITKYVIWANFDAGLEDMGDFSANYLGAVLLDEIGLPLSEFRMYQRNLMKEVPILSLHEAMDSEGNQLTNGEVNALDEISYYKIHEYKQIYGGN
ncbi:MAG: sulfatase-like hydrolase/transferase [Lachnospiraceae bacterium]|nr:sulfatase-like hydrolase/transferase [Lachnospiraceae bacterium]